MTILELKQMLNNKMNNELDQIKKYTSNEVKSYKLGKYSAYEDIYAYLCGENE